MTLGRKPWPVCAASCLLLVALTAGAQSEHELEALIHGRTAQHAGAPEEANTQGAFGADAQYTVFHASRFVPYAGTSAAFGSSGYIYPSSSVDAVYWTQLELPAGASVEMICWIYYDGTPSGEWTLDLRAYESAYLIGSPYSNVVSRVTSGYSSAPGYAMSCRSLSPATVIRNWGDLDGAAGPHYLAYALMAITDNVAGDNLKLFGASLTWKRTMSPAPATATFSDVPVGAFGFAHVEALAASGITAGCGGGNFCPNDPVTRVQMAVFLSKALGLHFPY